MQDLADHPFSPENIAYESGTDTPRERAYMAWVAQAEKLAATKGTGASEPGDLDGDEDADGFSLDGAYGAWEAGETPQEYVDSIAVRP